jgi:D-alanyl-lipoteichoic acid acyltransferase DltB (MBOAT superfamily)
MLFNSVSFLIFFPLTTLIYFVVPFRLRWLHLLLASALFYMAFVPQYIVILLFTVAVDYVAGLVIERTHGWARKASLAASILANVGILAVFKYFNFLNDNARAFVDWLNLQHAGWHWGVEPLNILLPIGLSFHTFQAMSYTIEVYYGRQRAERHPGIYALYVLFYPQLVAGPIERPQHLIHQFRRRHRWDPDRAADGLSLMLWGFFKKLVIADRMAPIVDGVFNHPQSFGSTYLVLATWCFAFQIYCDFSGYTDIARGAARVMGFRLMENFDRPYASASVGEFWRRWHISLSSWFRDYLYIPLGGNRVRLPRWCVNVLIVFVISGLWHGASWTFAVWGLLHGVYLIGSRVTRPVRERTVHALRLDRAPGLLRPWRVFVTFNLVALAWVFFRAHTVAEAFSVLGRIVRGPYRGMDTAALHALPFTVPDVLVALLLIGLMEGVQWLQRGRTFPQLMSARPVWVRWPAYYALLLLIVAIGDLGAKSFIYFQF